MIREAEEDWKASFAKYLQWDTACYPQTLETNIQIRGGEGKGLEWRRFPESSRNLLCLEWLTLVLQKGDWQGAEDSGSSCACGKLEGKDEGVGPLEKDDPVQRGDLSVSIPQLRKHGGWEEALAGQGRKLLEKSG